MINTHEETRGTEYGVDEGVCFQVIAVIVKLLCVKTLPINAGFTVLKIAIDSPKLFGNTATSFCYRRSSIQEQAIDAVPSLD